jgi:outer membrane protein assembly factor BamB
MKKSHITRAGLFCALSILWISQVHSQDWPQWRGANRDGIISGFKVPATWPQQFTTTWKTTVGLGDATPALVNNKLYVFTRLDDLEKLQCIDATSGKQLWISDGYSIPVLEGGGARHPGPRSSPVVCDNKVVTIGIMGVVTCFDAGTGKVIWQNRDFTASVPKFYMGGSPLVVDGLCLVHFGVDKSGQYVALSMTDGSLKWKTEADGPGYSSPVIMSVNGKEMVVFQGDTRLVGVTIPDGKIRWQIETPVPAGVRAVSSTSPVIDHQKVYYTGLGNGVNAIEIKASGDNYAVTQLWTNPDLCTEFSTPVIKDGCLYGLSKTNKLFCLIAGDGKTAWIDSVSHQNFGSVLDAGSVIIALSSTSNMMVYKPVATGYSQLAKLKVADTPVYAHPILSGNRIFIKDENSLILYTLYNIKASR